MRRLGNLLAFFSAIVGFFFGSFLTATISNFETIEICNEKYSNKLRESSNDLFIVVLILSAPNYEEKRDTMRNTWLKLSLTKSYYPEEYLNIPGYDDDGFLEVETIPSQMQQFNYFLDWKIDHGASYIPSRDIKIKHFFAIGTKDMDVTLKNKLDNENSKYHDLLFIEDLVDSYSNLTKKLLKSIEILSNTQNFDYILKVDDDTYVKLDYLANELVSYDRKLLRIANVEQDKLLPELYWGYFNGKANIKTKGIWKETHYNLCNHYIPYALGGGYVISRNIALYIKNNGKYFNTYLSEDVSMGIWLAPLKNIYRKHDIRFDTAYIPRQYKDYHLVLHKRSPAQMIILYKNDESLKDSNSIKGLNIMREYFYDWKKPPTNCCDQSSTV
ncbi:beta-1,3-galactosyltransferase 6 [Condylostylus longicornis]|uniref:beta-1,3-galactosyltransferase 6 n=1 Tax=Condylostylus longicornis TaxID=2530218 RepID=UPI00244DE06B|nr:beta-1,3-galactosyltransferase 6 [Condylostylus longicornis]